ncbi:MAG: EAL domain-containing protein [Rhodocyclaceae bacterium]|nr:MAG: EAL domain-containing protein [Rhodocyclaceae bacterium]
MRPKELTPLPNELASEAASLFRGLVNNELFGVYVIQDGLFVYVNPRLAEIFSYSQEALCGKKGPTDLTDPVDRDMAALEINRRVQGEVVGSHYTFKGLRKDGSSLDVEVFGTRTEFRGRPAIAGLLLDASARCEAERAMSKQLNLIAQLLETIPNPVLYKDAQGRYLGCNKAFEAFMGYAREDMIGKTVYDISPREVAEVHDHMDQLIFKTPGIQSYEGVATHRDGSRRDVMFYKAPFNNADGSVAGLVTVIVDITERKRAEELIWHQANYDSLTKLPNRRLFYDRLAQSLRMAHRGSLQLALLFIDLDRFKEVNDSLGHNVGDELLAEAARRIGACVRESDTVARLGGDEFTVILPDLADTDDAERVVLSILDALSAPFALGNDIAYVSASIGVTLYPRDADNAEALLKNADQAMYAAKAEGRNGFSYFTPSLQARAVDRLRIGNDLRQALPSGQLEVYYQPILDLHSGQIVKAEALLRWHHPERGMVSPAVFIPLAEELGLINEIGDWVFHQAAHMAALWHRANAALPATQRFPVQVAVNKSPRQFSSACDEGVWIDYLKGIGVPPSCVAVEITEGLLLDERPEIKARLMNFRDAGMQISLDDFGTGYSAMAYLKRFEIDVLKIDQSFVRDLMTDPGDLAISEAIIAMAHKLGIAVVAEGIESEEQRKLLADAGCDFGQGYLFSRPVPAEQFWRQLNLGSYPESV